MPAMFDKHKRHVQHAGQHDERKDEVVRQMKRCVDLDLERQRRLPDDRQHFARGLDCAFCPPELL